MTDELKPCAHCGGAAKMQTDGESGYWIECTNSACGCSTNIRIAMMDDVCSLLAETWNLRATSGAASGEASPALDALENRLALIHRLCCGLAPKQAVGELIDAMQRMPEWAAVRAALLATLPAAASQPEECSLCDGVGTLEFGGTCPHCDGCKAEPAALPQEDERDAARFRQAIALADNAEILYAAVLNHWPDADAIRREFDTDAFVDKEPS
ncbi:MAG: Lar family restriction alleviation protein [Telluria sp.]